jgi:GH24 family phage-related lysozyme (muramidase)
LAQEISKEAIDLIKSYEGLRLAAYPDPATKNDPVKKGDPWTIGYGHTGLLTGPRVKKGDKITKEQAEKLFLDDLNAVKAQVLESVKVPINEHQLGVLVSFAFNVGIGTFNKSSVLEYVNKKEFDRVPGRLALYRLANGKVMTGLVRRRAAEGALWMKAPPAEVKKDIAETVVVTNPQTVTADSNPHPINWSTAGAFVTLLAAMSDDLKKLLGNLTESVGVSPLVLIGAVGLGFAAYTVYNNWKKSR